MTTSPSSLMSLGLVLNLRVFCSIFVDVQDLEVFSPKERPCSYTTGCTLSLCLIALPKDTPNCSLNIVRSGVCTVVVCTVTGIFVKACGHLTTIILLALRQGMLTYENPTCVLHRGCRAARREQAGNLAAAIDQSQRVIFS